MPDIPSNNKNVKYIELEIDDKINSTLDVILNQLDKIRVNMQVK